MCLIVLKHHYRAMEDVTTCTATVNHHEGEQHLLFPLFSHLLLPVVLALKN